jgi:hypothetical protein
MAVKPLPRRDEFEVWRRKRPPAPAGLLFFGNSLRKSSDRKGAMSVISNSEREEFASTLRQHGYSETDFELEESEATRAMVAITHKRRSVCKIYLAGRSSNWLTEFTDDLVRGVFGAS